MTRLPFLSAALLLAACASPAPVKIHYPPAETPDASLGAAPVGTVAEQGPFAPNAYLRACYGIRVSNSPIVDKDGWVVNYKPIVVVNGIPLAAAPANDVCLTSGFGQRFGRRHDGIDLQSRPAGTIYASAPGKIIESRVSTGCLHALRSPRLYPAGRYQGRNNWLRPARWLHGGQRQCDRHSYPLRNPDRRLQEPARFQRPHAA